MTIDPSQALAFLKALDEGASGGTWTSNYAHHQPPSVWSDLYNGQIADCYLSDRDAALIAHVRNVLPQLIGVVGAAATSIQYAMDHDEYGLGLGRVPEEIEPIKDALTALAEAIAREQETK